MRIFILAILMLVASLMSFSQDSTIQLSKFEQFTSNTGRMIKTEFLDAGAQKDFKVGVIKATDMESNESLLAVQIYKSKNMFLVGTYKSSYLYIDWEEVPGFVKALKLQLSLLDSKPKNEVIYQYTTTNGVVTTCSYITSGPVLGWEVVFSLTYKHLRQTVLNSEVIIKKKDLDDIIDLLESAIKKNY